MERQLRTVDGIHENGNVFREVKVGMTLDVHINFEKERSLLSGH